MSKNTKLIILVLFVLLAGSVFVALSASSQKAALEQANEKLSKEITEYQSREKEQIQKIAQLNDQLKSAKDKEDSLRKRLNEINAQVQSLEGERDEWKSRVDGLREERDNILAQVKELEQKLKEKPKIQEVVKETPQITIPEFPEIPEGEMQDRYWAEVLKEKAALEIELANIKTELSSGLLESEELKKTNSDLELELSRLESEKEDLLKKIKYSEDLANTLSIELAREKNDKRYVTSRLDGLREENMKLRAQVKELAAAKVGLEKSITRLKEDKQKIEKSLAETESIIQNRIDDVLNIKRTLDQRLKSDTLSGTPKEIELPPIIVSAQPSQTQSVSNTNQGMAAVGFNGRILSINKENNFVICDLGENSGIRIGDTLSVYRDNKYIAGLEVIQVRKDISAADIKHESSKIKVGDIVK